MLCRVPVFHASLNGNPPRQHTHVLPLILLLHSTQDSGVGKSSLVQRFVNQSFQPKMESTVG